MHTYINIQYNSDKKPVQASPQNTSGFGSILFINIRRRRSGGYPPEGLTKFGACCLKPLVSFNLMGSSRKTFSLKRLLLSYEMDNENSKNSFVSAWKEVDTLRAFTIDFCNVFFTRTDQSSIICMFGVGFRRRSHFREKVYLNDHIKIRSNLFGYLLRLLINYYLIIDYL